VLPAGVGRVYSEHGWTTPVTVDVIGDALRLIG
jgi:hypothetical protein